ncbi:MAG: hypothetical protein LBL94_06175 [Prevotellaceae bacterium]|jgi:hypothetical protein|nr:hypothetical protein [Prevotellaceae bacterium]
MKRLLIFLAVLPLLRVEALAQYRKSFAISGGGGHAWTLWDKGDVYRSNRAGVMQMAEMNVKAGYYITPQFELGGSLSGVGYYNADISAIALSLTTQYDVTPRLFAGVNAGLPLSMGDVTEGFIAKAGVGYRVWQHSSGWSLNTSLGYRFMDYAYAWGDGSGATSVYEKRFNHGLYVGFCLEYTFASTLPQNAIKVEQRQQNRRRFWLTEAILMLFGWGASR